MNATEALRSGPRTSPWLVGASSTPAWHSTNPGNENHEQRQDHTSDPKAHISLLFQATDIAPLLASKWSKFALRRAAKEVDTTSPAFGASVPSPPFRSGSSLLSTECALPSGRQHG